MEDQIIMQAKGANGTLQLLPDRIRIVREGWLSNLYDRHSHLDLLLQQITAVELNVTIGGLAGYLAFHECEGSDAYEDYCVSFIKSQQHRFIAIHEAIEERLAVIRERMAQDRVTYYARAEV
ncbi:MAG TPA: hypothetical protein VKU00_23750 [Chthonomonadaceae bacterium]|nr:hypothetical protein [Chthonomonadaceae bacterium]